MIGIYSEGVTWVVFMYFVFITCQVMVTVGYSGVCCHIPCYVYNVYCKPC